MATTTPASVTQENSLLTTVISVVALVAVVALVYFIARGRGPGNERVPPQPPSAPAAPQ